MSMMPHGPDIAFEEVTFGWNSKPICDRFSLALRGGKTSALLGRSGAGKSTLLRLAAGLLTPQQGRISSSLAGDLSQHIAWMGQRDELYPWLSVRDNVTLSARLNGQRPDRKRAEALLAQVELAGLGDARPDSLSGGMRQRVALARTLYQDRPVVLMDEPFATLDVMTKLRLQSLTARVLRDKTLLLVTHDPLEACRLAHDIYLLDDAPLRCRAFSAPDGDVPRAAQDGAVLQAQSQLFQQLSHD
ncbi:putative hydroxymethylpyrimidine transport system ATP-binding protein [Pantoea piersonii]|jgi:putative hydroxymethylpyrimidine transport system ATP-binding protein